MAETQLAQAKPRASAQLALITGMDAGVMLDVIKAQCFKGNPANVSDGQLAAFVSIAAEMGVNPLLPGMLYAYPIQGGGIVPMMGPDGVFKKLTEHPAVEAWEVAIFPEDANAEPTHATAKIWRKGTDKPLSKTVYFKEWKISSNPNWQTRPRHMLEIRALKQCARQIIHGIPFDEDERAIMGEINVTPGAEQAPAAEARPKGPKRESKGAASIPAEKEPPKKPDNVVEGAFTDVPAAASKAKAKAEPEPEPKAEPKPEPEPEPKAPTKANAEPLTALRDGEIAVVDCTIVDVGASIGRYKGVDTPLVQVQLAGGFEGTAVHFGGATTTDMKTATPLPIYVPGAMARFTLLGKVNAVNKRMTTLIESVEAIPAAPVSDFE